MVNNSDDDPTYFQHFTNTTSGFTYSGGDVGYKFSLGSIENYSVPDGYIGVNASKVNSQSDIVFKYEHEEVNVSISPSFALDGLSIGVNGAAYYDPADIGTWYYFNQIY